MGVYPFSWADTGAGQLGTLPLFISRQLGEGRTPVIPSRLEALEFSGPGLAPSSPWGGFFLGPSPLLL